MKNDVWDIVLRLEGKSVVTSKWIYNIKHAVDGSLKKYKVILVARGFSHVDGIDYEETFAPISRSLLSRRLFPLQHPWVGDYIRWM